MKEVWEEIPGFPDYEVSNHGRVYSRKTLGMKATAFNNYGSPMVTFSNQSRNTTRSLSVLVAELFVPCPQPRFTTPIHLDGNRANCRSDNLLWRPRSFAVRYHRQFNNPDFLTNDTPVRVVGEKDSEFPTARDAAIHYGVIMEDILDSFDPTWRVFPIGKRFEPIV